MRGIFAAIASAFLIAAPAGAQDGNSVTWPQRQVTIVVPFAAGGSADLIARVLQQHLQAKTGVPVVVENKSGAGGSIGAGFVAKAPADGYTLLVGTVSTNAINAFLYSRLNFDVDRDFQAVSLLVRFPNLLIVNPRVPVKTVPELIAHLKAHAGQLNYGSSGLGTSSHLSVVMFELATGTKMSHEVIGVYKNMINNRAMALHYAAHSESLGVPSPEAAPDAPTGSTDMGDVSHVMPAIHPIFQVAKRGEGSCHEDAFVKHTDSEYGYAAMIRVAKALAMTAYDLLADPALLKAAKAEFAERQES